MLEKRPARGTPQSWSKSPAATPFEPTLARGSVPEIDDLAPPVSVAHHPTAPPRARGRWLARTFYLLSVAVTVATVTVTGVRMWRDAHRPPVQVPAAVTIAGEGRLELAPDRRGLTRIGRDAQWTSSLPTAVDTIEVASPVVLGRTSGELVVLDLESGKQRFDWQVPAGERWAVQSPSALGACLVTLTIRGEDSFARCLDLDSGDVRWTAKIAGGRECIQQPQLVPGAYIMQCPGWTTMIDDRNGKTSIDGGGLALVQQEPAILLRGGARAVLAEWSESARRFKPSGTVLRGALPPTSSAVLYRGRVVIRASSASDQIALILGKTGAPTPVAVPDLQLVDDAPLTIDCGTGTSPRFQLLELAPRQGPTFDSAAAQQRVLALLDVETGRLAWTSRKLIPPRRTGAATAPICRYGHYFVPVELQGAAAGNAALWIVDAESGTTTAALAHAEATFAELTSDQIDEARVVAVGRRGVLDVPWKHVDPRTTPGLRDGRADLEQVLGRVP